MVGSATYSERKPLGGRLPTADTLSTLLGKSLRGMPVRSPLLVCLFLSLSLSVTARTAAAQGVQGAAQIVSWSASTKPSTVKPGDEITFQLEGAIDAGWKMYAMDSPPPSRGVRVEFKELPSALTLAGEPKQSPPKRGYDPNFEKDVTYFEKDAVIQVPLEVSRSAQPGSMEVTGSVQFMVCNDVMCLPPTRVSVAAVLQVAGNPIPAETIPEQEGSALVATGPADTTTDLAAPESQEAAVVMPAAPGEPIAPADAPSGSNAGEGGLAGFLLLAILAGLAALLTPCVFPMIPLTVSYFTRHSVTRSESLRMAFVYGAAIILTFTGLGVLMALLVGAAGAQTIAANPWVNIFVGLVFIIFALSLLGLFELRLPSGLLNYFNRKSSDSGGYMGVLFMGLTLTLVSFSCTAPFVGGLLAATAAGQWIYPILGMLVFSTTFSLPFIFFALFPGALTSLPKSGSWMGAVKVTLGFVELAAALKFISNADLVWGWNVISRPLAIAVTIVLFFLAGLYLIGKLRLANEAHVEQIGVLRLLFAVLFFGVSLYMIPGLLGAPLNALDAYLPPRQATDVGMVRLLSSNSTGPSFEESWFVDDIDAALQEAAAENKPLFVDFTGYTCTNCRQMEANVFPHPDVATRFEEDFVLLRLYTDGLDKGEEFQRYQLRKVGTVALPTYAVLDPVTRDVLVRHTGMASVDEFRRFLASGVAAYKQRQLAAR